MIKNKKIIIVGGSSGIGFAVAQKSLVASVEVVIAASTGTVLLVDGAASCV